MNKQELIDKAVDDLKGNFETNKSFSYFISEEVLCKLCEKERYHYSEICTASEFTQRARELGWIKGYKYGVEYETNGKKPDLPEGTLLEITYACGPKTKEKLNKTTFDFRPMYDPRPVSFRIVDERYKPVEQLAKKKAWRFATI